MIMSMQKQHGTYGERQSYQSLQDKASRVWVWFHLYSMSFEASNTVVTMKTRKAKLNVQLNEQWGSWHYCIVHNRIKRTINYSCLVSDIAIFPVSMEVIKSTQYMQRWISDVWLTFTTNYIAYTHNKTANDWYGVMTCNSYTQGRCTAHWCIPLKCTLRTYSRNLIHSWCKLLYGKNYWLDQWRHCDCFT